MPNVITAFLGFFCLSSTKFLLTNSTPTVIILPLAVLKSNPSDQAMWTGGVMQQALGGSELQGL